jgi:hypothetical protein
MDLTEGSKTSAKLNLMPGENPKENTQDSKHGKILKSRMICIVLNFILKSTTKTGHESE